MSGRGPAGTWEYLAHWDGENIDLAVTRAGLPANDLAAAELIMDEWPGWLHFVPHHPAGTWYVWDGTCHRPDDSGEVRKLIIDVAHRLKAVLSAVRQGYEREARRQLGQSASVAEIDAETDKALARDRWEPVIKFAAGLWRSAGQGTLATVLGNVAGCSPDDLADRRPEWLNCANVTVDLRTGLVKAHDPGDLITYCLPVAYDAALAGQCPRFLALVHRMAGRVDAVHNYVLKMLGYCLIGANPERLIFFLNGPTSSGKSQVLYIVRQLLGVLATESQADLITYTRHGRNARTENSIRYSRLITINETSARMHIEEAQLKRLTGEKEVTVDQHYATDRLRTKVSWTIISATNDMPGVPLLDGGIRERMTVVPCGDTIPEHERDKDLAERILTEEAPAILATLIWYAGMYFREGLKPPIEVEAATDYYCSHQNIAVQFASDLLETGRAWGESIPGHQLWKACQQWGSDLGDPGRNRFYEMLAQVDGITRDDSGGHLVFRGIRWKQYIPVQYQ